MFLKEANLSSIEREMVRLIAREYPDQLIAQHLNKTEKDVKIHIASIGKKLNAKTRAEIVTKAYRYQLLP
ncbi:DNA-binding CsgD family transcriptional regulator [Gracilibacillus halotolerans]|uniref:DNA-binding CsgD family transcriptional regulator n=1 Tax=Gracilibacillus halotolerans TaxID=74386 RepID=A0A841RLQ8_9BACI|nr:DNA-binding CsgD family transcriptional regulator [Gracilibacillus halotolerans]